MSPTKARLQRLGHIIPKLAAGGKKRRVCGGAGGAAGADFRCKMAQASLNYAFSGPRSSAVRAVDS